MRIFFILSLLFFSFFIQAVSVFAVRDVVLTSDTTVVVPNFPTALISILAGATMDQIVSKAGNFQITMSAGNFPVTIVSVSRHRLDVTGITNADFVCGDTQSTLVLPAQSSAVQVTVTPGTVCAVVSAGGGASPAASPTPPPPPPPPPAPSPTPVPPPPGPVPSPIPVPSPAPSPVAPPPSSVAPQAVFNRPLTVGARGNDVSKLQQFFAKDPTIYPEGKVTGLFGALTREAVKKFQEKYDIASPGVPGYGLLGPKTRAKLNELSGVSPPPVGEPSPAPAPVPSPAPAPSPVPAPTPVTGAVLNQNIGLGIRSDDVSTLQQFLAQDPSIYPGGKITGFFGALTQEAVKKFQEKYDIASSGVPGYGFVGPKTRVKINELMSK